MGEGELSSILGLITPKQSLDPRQILFNDKEQLRIVTFSTTLALIRVMGRASLQFPNTVSSDPIVAVPSPLPGVPTQVAALAAGHTEARVTAKSVLNYSQWLWLP